MNALGAGVYTWWSRLRTRAFTELTRRSFAEFGRGSSVRPPAEIGAARFLALGDDVALGPYCRFLVGGSPAAGTIVIRLGDGVSIAGFCTISSFSSVVIEDRVLFARNVYVADHQHAFRDTSKAVRDQGVEKLAPVRICRGAWLGEGVVVGPGVTIGEGAVVGAHSFVRDDIPPYSLAVGAPARVVDSWGPAGPQAGTGSVPAPGSAHA